MNDVLLDSNQEIDIKDGDFVTGESTLQHQDLLIMTNKGEWKENPTIAVGALGYLKDDDESGFMAEVKLQLEKDGMEVKSIAIENENLLVNANY